MKRIPVALLLITSVAMAQEEPAEDSDAAAPAAETVAAADEVPGVKTLSGMSILGNEEAPKSLVIVPWKSSKLGDGLGVYSVLDESPRPVDREVFMRELHYHALRSGSAD